jgi:hypothetical protein
VDLVIGKTMLLRIEIEAEVVDHINGPGTLGEKKKECMNKQEKARNVPLSSNICQSRFIKQDRKKHSFSIFMEN